MYKFQTNQGPDNRGAEIEMPKASRGKGMGRGCTPPSRLRGLGSVVSSRSGVRGGALTENEFWRILELKNTPDRHKSIILCSPCNC